MKNKKNQKSGAFYYESPVGVLGIIDDGASVTDVFFAFDEKPSRGVKPSMLAARVIKQLDEYFSGERTDFELPLKPHGTPFQEKTWRALMRIRYGETCSYGVLAAKVGNKKACRAVGMANNRNPIVIIVPCHRVIGANGKLVGYGGGLDVKKKLLKLENKI